MTNQSSAVSGTPFLTIHEQPIYFAEDWAIGIGGGLWSTGLALGRYFQTGHAKLCLEQLAQTKLPHGGVADRKISVLELGSGNGFLSVCFLAILASAVAKAEKNAPASVRLSELVTTDIEDHLDMIRSTLFANEHIVKKLEDDGGKIYVLEHLWGEFEPVEKDEHRLTTSNLVERIRQGRHTLDLIIGSDLAYRKDLYDPLISSLNRFAGRDTVVMIGVTMADTTPIFFQKVRDNGFDYFKLADHLLEPNFRGTTFGIFILQKR